MKKHCLIVDSGATKAEWVLLNQQGVEQQFYTSGINITYANEEEIYQVLTVVQSRLNENIIAHLHSIVFYGAGCGNAEKASHLKNIIESFFYIANIQVYSDLLGACHALCNTSSGWVGILGTGSASCLYDGDKMFLTTPSPGYLLGDEGSGTYLGKIFLKSYLMKLLPPQVCQRFENKFNLTPSLVLEKLYRQPQPNRFISSLAPFLMEEIDEPYIREICYQNFDNFIKINLSYSEEYRKYKLYLLGSIAYYFKEIIVEVLAKYHLDYGAIEAAPMPRLINRYMTHLNNLKDE